MRRDHYGTSCRFQYVQVSIACIQRVCIHNHRHRGLFEHLLHDCATILMRRHAGLYALTELGDTLSLDLSVFEIPYRNLVRQVWREVPIVWGNGVAKLEVPPSSHPFAP